MWADLGLAPLAFAVEQLASLSQLTAQPLAAAELSSLTADYADRGWRADDAVLRALAAAPNTPDRDAVSSAIEPMYRPWLEAGAKALQSMIGPSAHDDSYQTESARDGEGRSHPVRRRPPARRRPPNPRRLGRRWFGRQCDNQPLGPSDGHADGEACTRPRAFRSVDRRAGSPCCQRSDWNEGDDPGVAIAHG